MKQWTITSKEKGFDGLEYGDVPVPKVGENDVLVKINGASLNYRDLIIPKVSIDPSAAYPSCVGLRGAVTNNESQGTIPLPNPVPRRSLF